MIKINNTNEVKNMSDFVDSEYAILIGNLLHDTQYIATSNMGKMSGLRKHAEVMVRKILNLGKDISLTLGQVRINSNNLDVRNALTNLDVNLKTKLINTVNTINIPGRDGTHTQHTEDFTNEEVENVENAIFDLYAIIFIDFFQKINIDIYTSPTILHVFSLLPPIIRYKTWSYLHEKNKNNIQVVNKLCLSIIKTYDKNTANEWLDKHKEEIKAIPYPTDSEIKKYIKTGGVEIAPNLYQVSLKFDEFDNMYDLLLDKINDENTSMNESGKMYSTFEEAIEHYNNFKITHPQTINSEEFASFHSLMEFVYLGRISNTK